MATRSLTIDAEAYDLLRRYRRRGQSFSDVIKERLGRVRTMLDLRDALDRACLSPTTLDAIDRVVHSRGRCQASRVRRD